MRALRVKSVFLTIFACLLALVFIFPFYVMIMMSTHVSEDIYKGIPLLPGNYALENLKTVFGAHFEIYYKNSIIVALLATVLTVFVCMLAGYALSKYQFKGSKLLFTFILVTMMVPTQLGLVAFVVEMKNIGWINTLLPLIIPPAASGFGVYWMNNYIAGNLPSELIESGRIDGAGELRIFFNISVPCIKPAIFSLAMMQFVTNWNSFLIPLVVLNKNETYTVPIGIINLNSAYRNDLAAKIMALSIGTIPLLIVFLIASKSFIKGLTMGAVKG